MGWPLEIDQRSHTLAATCVIAKLSDAPVTSTQLVVAFLFLLQPQFLNRLFLFRDLLHRESSVVFCTQIEAFLV